MTDANERPDKPLIVECPGCGSQFRFDRTLFHAAPGARVRCRRCGKSIEISNPDVQVGQSAQRPPAPPRSPVSQLKVPPPFKLKAPPPAPPPKAPSVTQPDAPPVAQSDAPPVARPTDTPARPDARSPAQAAAPTAAQREVLLSLDAEAQTLAPPEASQPVQSAPPPARPVAPSPARPKRSSPAAGRTTPGPPVPSSPVPPERGWKRRSDIFRVEEPAGGATEAHGRPKVSLVPYLVVAVAFVFALVAVSWYFETGGKEGGGAGTQKPAVTGAGTPKAAAPKGGGYKFERVETSYHRNPQAGLLFVLTGHVTPVQPSAGNGRIRVRVSVLGAENRVIAQKSVVAGVTIPDEVILQQGREGIDRAISDAASARSPAAAPAPAESLRFQAVFFDVAGKVGSYELAAERER